MALAMSRLPTGVPIGIFYLLFGEVFLKGEKPNGFHFDTGFAHYAIARIVS